MLAVVFGAEWFRTYVYGRPFIIESDHKPLESISKKSLADTPAQLWCILLHLQGYDYVLCYHPGKEMALPDILSHFKLKPGLKIALDIPIYHSHLSLSERKPSNWLLRWMLRCMHWLISSSLAGPMTSWKSNAYYIPTGNTVNPSLLKMDLCFMEKPSSSLHQTGRRSLILCTNHIKALPKHSCLAVAVSSCLVSARQLRKLFDNVKHA